MVMSGVGWHHGSAIPRRSNENLRSKSYRLSVVKEQVLGGIEQPVAKLVSLLVRTGHGLGRRSLMILSGDFEGFVNTSPLEIGYSGITSGAAPAAT